MKTGITLLYLFISVTSFGQNTFGTPYVKFYEENDDPYFYNKRLGVTDKDAVIVAPHGINAVAWCESYLVLLSNGSMYKYGVNTNVNPRDIRKEEVTDSHEKQKYLAIIEEINSLHYFNTTIFSHAYWQELEKDVNFIVFDGNSYTLDVTQGNKKAEYYTSAPEAYIETKTPGYHLKEQYLKVIDRLDFSAELFEPFVLPNINFQQMPKEVNYRVKTLLDENTGALVINNKIISQSEVKESFVVLNPDGRVFFYMPGESPMLKKREIIGNYRLRIIYWVKLISNLNPSILNIANKENEVGNKELSINNTNYVLEVYKGNSYSKFESCNPQACIKEKAAGYEMQQKLLYIMQSFDFAKNIQRY